MSLSLVALLRQRYLDTIRSVEPANGRWKILVVDKHTQDLLNNVLKPFEILELNVQQIVRIENQRGPQPSLDVVYILAPTSQNIDRIIGDFPPASTPSSSNPKKGAQRPVSAGPKYSGAWVYFVDGLDDRLAERLTTSSAAPYLRGFVELFTNFWADEAHVFTLRPPNPRSFFTYYAPPERTGKESLEEWQDEIVWTSRSIVNTLATLGENPFIRYYNPSSQPLGPGAAVNEHLSKRLATRLQADLDEYCRNNPGFPPPADPPRPRATMVVTERAMDLQAPLLHEFTYQAMCYDLLDIVDGIKYKYSFRDASGSFEEKEITLSDEDKVWSEVRHMHMKDALDKLIADFRTYAADHGHMTNGSSLNDMKDLLANLPQLRESKDKLSTHLTMAETCMDLFEKKRLPLVASVEQCCATGMTSEGKTPKTIVEEMVPLLDDRSVSSVDKVRIIALYIMSRDGVPEEDKRRLYQHARLGLHEMDAVNNLVYLGANVSKESGKKKKALFRQPWVEDAYETSRYQPVLKLMLDDLISGKLDSSNFPYVRDAPSTTNGRLSATGAVPAPGGAPASLRSARPRWPKNKPPPETKQRVIVFVAGGMTYSEIRSAYTVGTTSAKDIVIGSTHIYTPKRFVDDLSNMDRAGGSSLLSHGAPAEAYAGAQKAANKDHKKQEKERHKNGGPGVVQEGMERRYDRPGPPPTAPQASSSYGGYPQQGYGQGPPAPTPQSYRPPSNYGPPPGQVGYDDRRPSQASYLDPRYGSGPPSGHLQRPSLSASALSSAASFSSMTPIPSIQSGYQAGASSANVSKVEEKKKKGFFGRSKK